MLAQPIDDLSHDIQTTSTTVTLTFDLLTSNSKYEKENIWNKCQRNCTPTTGKTEEFANHSRGFHNAKTSFA